LDKPQTRVAISILSSITPSRVAIRVKHQESGKFQNAYLCPKCNSISVILSILLLTEND